ncbi:MAG: benzoate-CoA ligase family protein [bacterium]|nr:benzoate-CoA ligase family protein [bacterium]
MQDHTVAVDRSTTPTSLTFAPVFNVAVAFIDRHIEEGRSDKLAIRTTKGEAVTFGALADSVNRTGNVLQGLGIKRGERVLMVVKDCPQFFGLFWGAIKAGIIPVPLNTLLRAPDYRFMIEDSECAGIVYSPEYATEVEPALAAAALNPKVCLPIAGEGECLDALIADVSSELVPVPAKPEDDCFWLYSSGTTGTPKGAVHVHRDMVLTSELYGVGILGMRDSDVCFSAAKLFFAYGLGNAMTMPLWTGASAVLLPGPPTPQVVFDVIEQYKPTLFFGVPTLYAAQLRELDQGPQDLSSLRACISAGEALPADIFRRWHEKTGCLILDGIGSTEALHIFISNRDDGYRPGSSGRPVPGYDAAILDDAGQEVSVGESGRLKIRGQSNAAYYWNDPEKTRAIMVDGWLDTGDTYYRDEEGYYYFCGRNDDMLKVGGIWCSPFEIEAKLIEHPRVLEAAVVGKAADDGLIKPAAFVVLIDAGEAGDAMAEELLQHCKNGLAKYKYPRWITFSDQLPKTATGKIQRYKLR